MATIWKFTKTLLVLLMLVIIVWGVTANYSVIFSKTVNGEVTNVQKVEIPVALISRADNDITSKVFSFAIGIRDKETGEIYTASSEDRQWAIVQPGQCAEAVFLPYPPWDFQKKGTYFGARLTKLMDCPK